MTQFIVFERRPTAPPQLAATFPGISQDEFLVPIVSHYFPRYSDAVLCIDSEGAAESFTDDIHLKQKTLTYINDTPLIQLLIGAFRERIGFIMWCGTDWHQLPIVFSEAQLMEQLTAQTEEQPAEIYLAYTPQS